jgi:hypothetical protein
LFGNKLPISNYQSLQTSQVVQMVLPSFVLMKSTGGRGVTSLSGTWGGGVTQRRHEMARDCVHWTNATACRSRVARLVPGNTLVPPD